MARQPSLPSRKGLARQFANAIYWIGAGLVMTFLLWTFALVLMQAFSGHKK
ncbi:MAG: hypothetical protein K6T49_00585 [Acidobacterium ailaaui]|nr:hypothetical protein [Pseudacidobacterium ailaaui]